MTPNTPPSSDDGVVLRASRSHLFPGARLSGPAIADTTDAAETPVLVVFADGAVADAVASGGEAEGRSILTVASYSTTAGTAIDQRAWIIEEQPDAEGLAAWRVAARSDR